MNVSDNQLTIENYAIRYVFMCLDVFYFQLKLLLVLINHHAMTYVALYGGEWSASCPFCITTSKTAPSIHWTRYLVDYRASLYAVIERKLLLLSGVGTPVIQLTA